MSLHNVCVRRRTTLITTPTVSFIHTSRVLYQINGPVYPRAVNRENNLVKVGKHIIEQNTETVV